MYCSNCGAQLEKTANYCSNCGFPTKPVSKEKNMKWEYCETTFEILKTTGFLTQKRTMRFTADATNSNGKYRVANSPEWEQKKDNYPDIPDPDKCSDAFDDLVIHLLQQGWELMSQNTLWWNRTYRRNLNS